MATVSSKAMLATTLTVLTLGTSVIAALPAEAQYYGSVRRQQTGVKGFFNRHPKVKAATIGAGVGTAAGAATGLISGRGVVRGGLIGAGAGAGVGLIRSSRMLRRHPIVKDTATGTVAGLGLGLAASRGRNAGLKGAAAGAAIGLGLGALRQAVR